MTVRELQQPRGWAFDLAVAVVKPTLLATTKRTWLGGENIPATGGCIVVFNHISHLDPLTAAHFLYDHGRLPRYLAKSGLFKNKALAGFLRAAGQIPVERLGKNAKGAYDAAVAAVRAGECVVVYPEGTLTRDPRPVADDRQVRCRADRAGDRVPGDPRRSVGRPGAAAALHQDAASRAAQAHPMLAGPPVPLDDLMALPRTPQVFNEATARIMAAITELVEEVRQEKAPAERYDPRKAGDRLTGDPRKKDLP